MILQCTKKPSKENLWTYRNDESGTPWCSTSAGRLTLGDESRRLKDKINSVLQDGIHDILLNLGDVSYIDSGGLGQLVLSFTAIKPRKAI